jgi:hypothetical protein
LFCCSLESINVFSRNQDGECRLIFKQCFIRSRSCLSLQVKINVEGIVLWLLDQCRRHRPLAPPGYFSILGGAAWRLPLR